MNNSELEGSTTQGPAAGRSRAAKTTKAGKDAKKSRTRRNATSTRSKTKTQPEARIGSKKEIVLGLLRRKEGASIAEIAKATGWQNHTIRGFLSGTVTKKMGLTLESVKNEGQDRKYRIA